MDAIQEYLKTVDVIQAMVSDNAFIKNIYLIADVMTTALKNNKKIIFCGNGGSAADSQHLAAELVSRLMYDRPALAGVALTVDTSALTAIGNDYGYDHVFSRQVQAIGQEGDVLVAISTSGRSKNVFEAVKAAKEKKLITIGFLGKDGKDIGHETHYSVNIPSSETPKIQEGHIMTGHILCALLEENIYGSQYNPSRIGK